MRVVQVERFGSLDDVTAAERPDPRPGPDDVLVDVAAAGVNFPDVLVVEGAYQTLPPLPFVPGKEAAGTIAAVGPNVIGFAPGDRVLAMVEYGAFAERLAVPAEFVVRIPASMTFTKASAFGLVYSTAHLGLVRRARVRPGEWVLVTGANGGVGAAAVQLAKTMGARVIALTRDAAGAEAVEALGADETLTLDIASLRDDLLRITGGHGVDVTMDMVGGDVLSQAIRATAWEGRVVIVGFAAGSQNPIKPGYLLVKNISVLGLQSSDYRDRTPALMRAALADMLQACDRGEFFVPLDRAFPLAEARAALERVKEGGVRGRVALVMGEGTD